MEVREALGGAEASEMQRGQAGGGTCPAAGDGRRRGLAGGGRSVGGERGEVGRGSSTWVPGCGWLRITVVGWWAISFSIDPVHPRLYRLGGAQNIILSTGFKIVQYHGC
jgi:hypothetical protein